MTERRFCTAPAATHRTRPEGARLALTALHGVLLLLSALSVACGDEQAATTREREEAGERDEDAARDGDGRDAAASRDASSRSGDERADASNDEERTDGDREARSDGGRDTGAKAPGARAEDAGADAVAPDGSAEPENPSGGCGGEAREVTPFGCGFAWGTNEPEPSLPDADELAFHTKWVGYETDKEGRVARCDGCAWLSETISGTSVMPVYYAYFIGFLGSANGFADQNVNPDGPNLATDGARLIREKRAVLLDMYASYAKQSEAVWSDKPLVWLLEGDFVQYTYDEQQDALTMRELAELARDITCAIKGNMPKAVVAINHSTWLSDEVTNAFWEAMEGAGVAYDLVWTTGVANNGGFLEAGAAPGIYNEKTATYGYLSRKTGRKILVDTSFGLSGMSDTWASASPETLDERIGEGVIAANVTMPPTSYVRTVQRLTEQLTPVCQ